jgi:hypothetical protein
MAIGTYAIKGKVASTTLQEVLELATSESVTVGAALMGVDGGGIVKGVRAHVRYEGCRRRHKCARGYVFDTWQKGTLAGYITTGARQLFERSKRVPKTKDASRSVGH